MGVLHVALGERSYDLIIERGCLSKVGEALGAPRGAFVLTDSNIAPLYLGTVVSSLKSAGFNVSSMALPAGEKTKAFASMMTVYDALAQAGITRSDLVIALGGGVIGDLCGFAAATYLRGVDFVQIPTSLLAQVDSSIGGKVAVDLPWGKNLAGAFYQPKAVFIDPNVLDTLPDHYFSDGMAEVIKYGCIKDKALFDRLAAAGDRAGITPILDEIIYTCCDVKRSVVERDERDTGERMLLNFGHTYGHALEKYYDYAKVSHGEAVAVGMRVISEIAEAKGLTAKGTAQEIARVCRGYGLSCEDEAPYDKVITAIGADKKNYKGKLNVVLLKQIGDSYIYPTSEEFWR